MLEEHPLRESRGLDGTWVDRVDTNPAPCQLGRRRARERELSVLCGCIGPRSAVCDRPGDRCDVDDVGRPPRFEERQEGEQGPDRAKVVRAGDPLDLVRRALEEAFTRREARVVDEEEDLFVALGDPRCGVVHLPTVGDVALLGLGAELLCYAREPLRVSGEQDATPASLRQDARGCCADPARSTGDHCDGHGPDNRLTPPWR
jgi:hypothetical protein